MREGEVGTEIAPIIDASDGDRDLAERILHGLAVTR
jgi:hypothetical protein